MSSGSRSSLYLSCSHRSPARKLQLMILAKRRTASFSFAAIFLALLFPAIRFDRLLRPMRVRGDTSRMHRRVSTQRPDTM